MRHPLPIGLIALVCAAGCLHSDFNLATQRQDLSFTSTDKEVEIGRKLARRVERELTLVPDESLQRRVQAIGQRLAEVCDRRELVYSFAVVKDDDINAFSLPGGYVYVNSGLIDTTSGDDELAGVLAHEIAHIAARHAVSRYESAVGMQLVQLATLASGSAEAASGVGIANRAAQLAYARDAELEADRLGVKYMKAAGFNPEAVLTFLKKLQADQAGHSQYLPRGIVRPYYAATHPFVPERIRGVKESLYGVADYIDYLNTPE